VVDEYVRVACERYQCVVGSGIKYILEERDDGFVEVLHLEEYLAANAHFPSNETTDAELEDMLKQYLDNFIKYSLRYSAYDARARAIARRVCRLFGRSEQEVTATETVHSEEGLVQQQQEIYQREFPNRILKVGVAAIGGECSVSISTTAERVIWLFYFIVSLVPRPLLAYW
jgi:hypothetical protein